MLFDYQSVHNRIANPLNDGPILSPLELEFDFTDTLNLVKHISGNSDVNNHSFAAHNSPLLLVVDTDYTRQLDQCLQEMQAKKARPQNILRPHSLACSLSLTAMGQGLCTSLSEQTYAHSRTPCQCRPHR